MRKANIAKIEANSRTFAMGLTDIGIRNAKPAEGRTSKLSDGGGLQLWVTPSGSKLWYLAYRFDGKQRKLAFGPHPLISLKTARDKRDEAKRVLLEGLDPGQVKIKKRQQDELDSRSTFALVAEELLEKKRREGRAARTLEKVEWLFGLVASDLGDRPIAQISAADVLASLRKVEARGHLETAKRLRAIIGEVFRYAVATQRALGDPTGALRGALAAPKVQHRAAIIDPEAFGGLLRAIQGYDGAIETRFALELAALTFVRPGELRAAEWPEIDLKAAVWTIPGSRMKMRRPHRVPLAPRAVVILTELQKITGKGRFLFPSQLSRQRCMSENTVNSALRRLGYGKEEMTGHGFRSSASSLLNESGLWNPDAIEAQLAHVEGNAVRRAYARAEFWPERLRMMAWWADKLEELRIRPVGERGLA
jgi:integrase